MNDQSCHKGQKYGILYVVSTPIGNLEDITLRALKVLKNVGLIAAEKVSHTRGLCRHYGIETRLISYHQHNRKVKAPELIEKLKAGGDIAVVTDAGTPGISDPGVYLINRAVREEIKVVAIPGPSAVITGLSISGLPAEQFVFLGFLPNRSGKRKSELRRLASQSRTMVFFEAPHRIKAMLADLREILGDREVVMLRELTKVFEEVKRGTVSTILRGLASDRIRGEFTLVVAGRADEEKAQALSGRILRRIEGLLVEKKMRVKDIALLVSSEEGLAYRQIYKECLARKKARGV